MQYIILFLLFLFSCTHPIRTSAQSFIPPPIETTVAAAVPSICPENMVLIEGEYCPKVEEICLYSVDNKGKKLPPEQFSGSVGRCGEFKYPTKCLSTRVHKRFCIDKYELPNIEGQRPTSWLSWDDSKSMCEAVGKRLCTSSEWEFACEGGDEDPHPYPYRDGYHRNNKDCNTDNIVPKGMDVFKAKSHNSPTAIQLDAMLVPSGSMKNCVSPFGVYDQVGNLDEWVVNETGIGFKTGLKGGHIWGVRARCRPMTVAHNGSAPVSFAWYESSARCCL